MEARLHRALVAWVDGARRRARTVVAVYVVLTLGLGAYAALNLGVNTHHTAILADHMPFWQDYNAFAEVFPILDEALLVVVDAETASAAREAAVSLAEELEKNPDYGKAYLPGGDPFFERHGLLYLSVDELAELSDQMAVVQPMLAQLASDSSLIGLADVMRRGIESARTDPNLPIDLTLAFDSLSRAARAVVEGNPRPISWSELVLRRKLPGDDARRLVILNPRYDFDSLLPGRAAMEGVREAALRLGLVPENGVRVRLTGNVALSTEEMRIVTRGTLFAATGALLIVGVILTAAMRTWHLVGAALLTLVASLIWTAAFAAAAVGHVNLISVAFAVLIIGLGVDFGIHFGMRYAELRRGGAEHAAALEETTESVGGSLVICAITTAIGFLVFLPTDYKAVGELGLIAGAGMLVCLVSTLTLMPALLTLWRDRPPGDSWRGALIFERIVVTASAHHPRAVRLTALALALGSVGMVSRVHFDHNVAAIRDQNTESVETFNELLAESDTSPWTVDVMAPSLEQAQAIARRLRELPEVERAITLADYVPEQQDEKLALLEDLGYFVPQPVAEHEPPREVPLAEQIAALRSLRDSLASPWLRRGEANRAESARSAERELGRFLARLEALDRKREQAEALAAFEHSLTGALPEQLRALWRALDPDPISVETLPESLRERMVSPEGLARVEVLPAEDLSDNAAHARFVDRVRQLAPEATGSAVTLLEFGRAVVRSFREALLSATLAIAVLLLMLWRRLDDTFLVMAPLLLAALLTAATAGLLGLSFNFANVIVLPLLLGIGVDSGIHLVHRHRVTIETLGHAEQPERELLETSTAQAVFFSALTTIASFGSLAFSSHVGFASLGKLLLIGVTYVLLCNLIVLPALLALRMPARERPASEAA